MALRPTLAGSLPLSTLKKPDFQLFFIVRLLWFIFLWKAPKREVNLATLFSLWKALPCSPATGLFTFSPCLLLFLAFPSQRSNFSFIEVTKSSSLSDSLILPISFCFFNPLPFPLRRTLDFSGQLRKGAVPMEKHLGEKNGKVWKI